ncbi:MAG TPA: AAA family ATPase [Pyrinomonadaceae bacterium]|nr:AAA family ATPase [Pyrinomonadaceae bacterium]
MLTAGLLILSLLSVGAVWFALSRLRASEAGRGQAERELALARERHARAMSALREQLEAERRRAALKSREEEAADGPRGLEEGPAAGTSPDDAAGALLAALEGPAEAAAGDGHDGRRGPAVSDPAEVSAPADSADEAQALAWSLDDFYQRTTHPRELLPDETFRRGVEMLCRGEHTTQELILHAVSPNGVLACMALEALALRPDREGSAAERLIEHVNDCWHWQRFFALRALEAHARRPVLARLLAALNGTWRDYVPLSALREFVARRVAAGDEVTAAALVEEVTRRRADEAQLSDLGALLEDLGDALPEGVASEFSSWLGARSAVEFLRTVGRVWEPGGREESGAEGPVFVTPAVGARVAELEAAVKREPARSVLLVGDAGTGKTALVRALAERLFGERWIVFEAGAADVLAGQQYIGQLEARVQSLVRQLGGRRVLWVVPNFHETLWAGRHQFSPVGLLDLLLPSIEAGAVRLVGEVPSAAYVQLMRLRPKLRTAVQTFRVAPLGDEETLELGRRWAESFAPEGAAAAPRVSDETLREALQLAKQYLGDKAAPGNLLLFLEATRRRLLAEDGAAYAARALTLDDLLVTLSQLTGLPVSILDEREGLDLAELRAFFEQRVLGQPEAVDCLVERVAMIKAGLTDPTRPQGVFLFVGPTGTGKTEIAKTLAEFLFGSPERMIRLDMSEFQTPDSLDRILGESSETSDSAALVNAVRRQPFSVVLLDEFEKAHPQVWDLFLQVFDDGRLTDRRGNTADFRHAVFIMTSNLGATLPHGASIGFSQEQAQFAAGSVERAVARAFRREFVNRIDRVVVFRPLGRAVMRDLLRKELQDVLGRRGLRTRQWAVEWDESAVDFLLEMGFTADLGARPLKRAVERYLLSPLAVTIVNHQFPEGDQFLFVRAADDGQSLAVEFVDPDAPPAGEAAAAVPAPEEELPAEAEAELSLERIAFDPRGTRGEVRYLHARFAEVAGRAESEDWRRRKSEALEQTQQPGFWTSPERFTVLGLAEYMDRVEAGLDTAGSLLARLRGDRERYPADLVGRLAEQLYLLDAACRGLEAGHPRDAFLQVRAGDEPGTDRETSERFARRLTEMYRGWAEKRRMRFALLAEAGGAGAGDAAAEGQQPYEALLAVSGYAAFTLLSREAGLHVLETPQDEKSFNRARVRVRVVAQPDEPAGHGPDALRRQAERAFEAEDTSPPQIVRRYREEPSPLVRDSLRGWRTGKIERVLAGDFDLIT